MCLILRNCKLGFLSEFECFKLGLGVSYPVNLGCFCWNHRVELEEGNRLMIRRCVEEARSVPAGAAKLAGGEPCSSSFSGHNRPPLMILSVYM